MRGSVLAMLRLQAAIAVTNSDVGEERVKDTGKKKTLGRKLARSSSSFSRGRASLVNERRPHGYLASACAAAVSLLYARSAAATTTAAAAAAAVFIATITSDRAVPSQINSQGGEFVLHRWVSSLMEETVPREQMN